MVTPEGWGGKASTLWLVPGDPRTSFQVQTLPGEAQGGHLAGPGTHLILAQGVCVLTGACSPMEIPQLSGFMCVSGVMLKVCKAQLGLKQHFFLFFLRNAQKTISPLCFWCKSKFPRDSFFVCVMGQHGVEERGAP